MTVSQNKPLVTAAFKHNYISNLRLDKRIIIVLTVLHFVGLPMNMIISMVSIMFTKREPDLEAYASIGAITSGVAFLVGIACAFMSMQYLYRKVTVDMRLSLPMSAGQRFISDFLSGLTVYVMPFLVNMALGFALLGVGHGLFDGRTFESHYRAYDGTSDNVYNWVCDFYSEAAPYLFRAFLGALVVMILLYALSTLVMCFCGSLLENICYVILVNCLIPGFTAIICYCFSESVYGLDFGDLCLKYIPFSSPLGATIYFFSELFEEEAAFSTLLLWAIKVLIAAAVYTVGAFFVYKKRNAEDTGKPVVFDLFYTIIMLLSVASLIMLIMSMDNDAFLAAILVTAVFFFVLTVIKNRGFKKFGRAVVSYVIITVVSFVFFGLIWGTNGFGIGNYIPPASGVSSVVISYSGYGVSDRYYSYGSEIKLTSRESINAVTEVHNDIINAWKDLDDSRKGSTTSLYIKYRTLTGQKVVRQYNNVPLQVLDKLHVIDLNEDMRSERARIAEDILKEQQEMYNYRNSFRDNGTVNVAVTGGVNPLYNYYSLSMDILPADFTTVLAQKLRADIMNEPAEAYYGTDDSVQGFISFDRDTNIIINSTYKETLNYLVSCGFKGIPVMDDKSAENLYSNFGNDIRIISMEMYRKYTGTDADAYTGYQGNVYAKIEDEVSNLASRVDYTHRDEMLSLLQKARRHCCTDKAGYMISMNNGSEHVFLVIPAEYNAEARKLFVESVTDNIMMTNSIGSPVDTYTNEFIRAFAEYYKDDIISMYDISYYEAFSAYPELPNSWIIEGSEIDYYDDGYEYTY